MADVGHSDGSIAMLGVKVAEKEPKGMRCRANEELQNSREPYSALGFSTFFDIRLVYGIFFVSFIRYFTLPQNTIQLSTN